MTDRTGHIYKVESERQNAPGTGNNVIETERIGHSGLITAHGVVPGAGAVTVFTVPAGQRAYITRLIWDWTDVDGTNSLTEDQGGAAQAILYQQDINNQILATDRIGLDWGDGSYPVITAVAGDFSAANVAGIVASQISVTYYLEAVI